MIEEMIREHRIAGIINDQITPETAALLGAAVGAYLKNQGCKVVATARDFSTASRMFKRAFSGGLLATGLEILDLHATSTAILQFVVRRFGAEAGLSFSGRHETNVTGVRLFDENGIEFNHQAITNIRDIYRSRRFKLASARDIGNLSPVGDTQEIYKGSLKGVFGNGPIKDANYRLVIDCALGPMSETVPTLLAAREFKVDVVALNSYRPHGIPEVLPSTDSLEKLKGTVLATNSDLGVAFDCEGNQTVFIDKKGNLITADEISCLLLQNYESSVKEGRETIVIGSTTLTKRADQSLPRGTSMIRVTDTPGSIASVIRDERAVFGVSDRGVYFFPSWSSENDGIYALFVLLDLMTTKNEDLGALIRKLPVQTTYQQEIQVDSAKQVKKIYNELWINKQLQVVDTLLGIKLIFEEGWVHVIPSNEKSSFTLIAETIKDESQIPVLFTKAKEMMNEIGENLSEN
ncbi:MAG: hypothetical protein ACXAEU_10940 [Candidatus Hodarchaeales archaeon]|jgi:phosphomannomutase